MNQKDLLDIIYRGFEPRNSDYKQAIKWDETDKKACAELVKDILAMANSGGGHLVVGVKESGSGFQYTGLDEEQLKSFETSRLNRFVQKYSDPPINCTIVKTEDKGKNFVIITIPSFDRTPHICQKDYPEVLRACALYVRTANNESAEVRSSSDVRSLIERAVRNQQDYLLTSFRAILTGAQDKEDNAKIERLAKRDLTKALSSFDTINPYKTLKYGGFLDLWSYPLNLKRDIPVELLLPAATRASEDLIGWPFLFVDAQTGYTYNIKDGIECAITFKDFLENDRIEFWQFLKNGFFLHRSLMWEESLSKRKGLKPIADITSTINYIAEGLLCVSRLYDSILEPDESVKIVLRLTETQGRKLTNIDPNRGPILSPNLSRVPEILFEKSLPLADLKAGLIDHSMEFSKYVFLQFNWQQMNVAAVGETIRNLLSRTHG